MPPVIRHRAEQSGTSIRALVIGAIEQAYVEPKKARLSRDRTDD